MKTAPIAPDPWAFGVAAGVAGGGATLLTLAWPWYLSLLVIVFIVGGFAFLFARAHRSYKAAAESYALWKRAQPAIPAMSDPHSIYNIHGTVSLRTQDGGWFDIGEGAATFTIKPPKVAREAQPGWGGGGAAPGRERIQRQTPPTG